MATTFTVTSTKAQYHSDIVDKKTNAQLSVYLDAHNLIHIGQTAPQGFDADMAYKVAQELTYIADLASGRLDEMAEEWTEEQTDKKFNEFMNRPLDRTDEIAEEWMVEEFNTFMDQQ